MQHRARTFFLAMTLGASSFCAAQLSTFSTPLTSVGQVGPATLTGTVVGSDGSPLHDIRIEIHSVTTGALVETCFTAGNGSFEVISLRPGAYELVAVDGVNETRERVSLEGTPINVSMRIQSRAAISPKKGTVSVVELRTPEKARRLTDKAHNALVKNHTEEAQKEVDEALAIAPDYPEALTLRAVIKISANQPEAAMDDLDHAIKSDPAFGRAYLVMGAMYNQMGRSDDALRSLDRAAMYEPQSWQCALEESKAWLAKHDYQHALEQLSRAQALGGERIAGSVHLLRGYALMGQKHLEQAATELEAYLTADPNSQLAGSVRMALAKIKSSLAQEPQSVPLTAVTGLFAPAH